MPGARFDALKSRRRLKFICLMRWCILPSEDSGMRRCFYSALMKSRRAFRIGRWDFIPSFPAVVADLPSLRPRSCIDIGRHARGRRRNTRGWLWFHMVADLLAVNRYCCGKILLAILKHLIDEAMPSRPKWYALAPTYDNFIRRNFSFEHC